MILLPILFGALQAASPTTSAGELVSQRVEGTRRICVYDNPRAAPRRRESERQRLIGRGEPCPRWDPGPPPPRRISIPSLATLAGDRIVAGQRICVYRHLGREYLHPIAMAQSCPLTPHFFQ